jgi:hypothetical protein
MKTAYTMTERTLEVKGTTWGGFNAKHKYPLKDNQTPVSLEDAKRIAGDFKSLTYAAVVEITKEVVETIKTKKLV